MKTRVKIQSLLTAATLAATLALQPTKSFADDTKPDAKAQAAAKAAMGGYDLVISGGVLVEPDGRRSTAELPAVVDVLRKQYPDANIVIAPELSQTILADLKLHAHELPEMLEALRAASGGKFDWSGPGSPGAGAPGAIDPTTGLPVGIPATPAPNSGLYVLGPSAQKGQNERVVEALNLDPFIKAKLRETDPPIVGKDARALFAEKMEDNVRAWAVDAVSACDGITPEEVNKRISFRYHNGANLLVAIGSRADLDVIRNVVRALTGDQRGGIRSDLEISPSPFAEQEPVSVEPIQVKFAKVESAYAAATSLLSDKRSKVVACDARTKTLIVLATKAEANAIRAAIEQLDQAARQSGGSSSGSSGTVPQKEN